MPGTIPQAQVSASLPALILGSVSLLVLLLEHEQGFSGSKVFTALFTCTSDHFSGFSVLAVLS